MKKTNLITILLVLFSFQIFAQNTEFPTDKIWWQQATVKQIQQKLNKGAKINGMISDDIWKDEKKLKDISQILLKTSHEEIIKVFETPLKMAAMHCSDLAVTEYLISKGARLSDQRFSKYTFTPLTNAILYNPNIEVAKYLVQKKVNINEIQFGNVTTLMLSTASKDINRVKLLLDNGADVSLIDSKGRSVIDRTTNEEIIDLLLKHGAKTNQKLEFKKEFWSQLTPDDLKSYIKKGGSLIEVDKISETYLHYAARYSKSSEILNLLIENGIALETRNKYELTPLLAAAASNSETAIFDFLINKGADINAVDNYNSTALMLAAKYNSNIEALSYFLKKGIDPNTLNKNGLNALFYVLESKHQANKDERMKLLVSSGANLMNKNKSGYYAANYALNSKDDALIRVIRYNANAKTVRELIDQIKPDLNRVLDKSKETALSAAILKNDDPEVIKVLIEKGANPYQNVYYANTALDLVLDTRSEKSKVYEKTKILLESGFDPNCRYNEKMTYPIITAASWHKANIVKLLLDYGAKTKVTGNITGGNPLHSAASADNPDEEVLILLINNKTKVKAKDNFGKTPLDCANKNKKINKNSEGYKLLKSRS